RTERSSHPLRRERGNSQSRPPPPLLLHGICDLSRHSRLPSVKDPENPGPVPCPLGATSAHNFSDSNPGRSAMQIDPGRRGALPPVATATPFQSPDGRFRGWKVRIPGGHSLATPAVVNGRVFLGGGFGSYDFYAFDVRDGSLAWQHQTTDDGPTAA